MVESQGRNSRKKPTAAYWLAHSGLLTKPMLSCLGMVPPAVDCMLLHQLAIKKNPYR